MTPHCTSKVCYFAPGDFVCYVTCRFSCVVNLQGGFEYKKAIVDTIITIIEDNTDAKESGQ